MKSKKREINLKKLQIGLTLAEVLVVIFIITAIILVVVSNFPQTKLQSALLRVTYKFEQDLRKAQNLALSATKYGGTEVVGGYGVYVNLLSQGNKKYIIYADKVTNPAKCNSNSTNCLPGPVACNGNEQYGTSFDYIIDTIDFSSTEPGIIIKEIRPTLSSSFSSINFSSCDFSLITKITVAGGTLNLVEIVFAFESDPNRTRAVSINSNGLVQVIR